ncbi:MAG TPA: DUF6691 family protein [Terriglobales bacterium]|jgi:uncharacterized membrane protein YedE/YeeE|nr:DUF6691 family protein [Terriglobales bacterium]
MSAIVTSLAIGALFGFGLSLSEMINPARVIGFLDVAGPWDATLLFVMAGALMVTMPLYPWVLRQNKPLLGKAFILPTKRKVDTPLVFGAGVFGIGWGLAGFCPGPALAAIATGQWGVLLFVAAMIAGQWLAGLFASS